MNTTLTWQVQRHCLNTCTRTGLASALTLRQALAVALKRRTFSMTPAGVATQMNEELRVSGAPPTWLPRPRAPPPSLSLRGRCWLGERDWHPRDSVQPGQEDRAGSDMTFLTLEETLKVGNLDEVYFEDIRFGAESFHLNVLIMHWMLHWNVPIMHLNFAGHHGVDAGGVTAARVSTEHSSRLLHNRAGVGPYTHHPTIWSPSCCGRAHMCWHVYTVALVKLHTCFLYHTASLGVYEL